MPPAADFEGGPVRLTIWRAVEAQQLVSTMALVDTLEEQRLLEELLDSTKPPVPTIPPALHYLLFTPFRYPPTAFGSRFRRPGDLGVFYGGDQVRTACAELGFWRWRFLMDSPDLERLLPVPQTVFQVTIEGQAVDLRVGRLAKDQARWTDPNDYAACQALADQARHHGVVIIRYQSVRDPEHGPAAAVLDPKAFAEPNPLALETWYLAVTRDRVWWCRDRLRGDDLEFEFDMARWRATA